MEEMLAGESNTIEYKRELSFKSEGYIKTIIAFANTNGGRLIIGIEDTLEIIGVDPQKVFQIIDAIANTISDTCIPQIIPNISFQNIEDTCIIIVEIAPGGNRPYYVKALGMEKGCFVRIAGTTRPADACKRKELQLEEAMQGRSKIRNHAIAEVFGRMGILEAWGTGIHRILKRAQEYQLPKPLFKEFGDSFRVNFYRPTVQKLEKRPVEKADRKQMQYQKKLQYIEENGSITNAQARSLLQLAESTVKRICRKMVEEELLLAEGERLHRIYKIKKS